MITRKKLKSKVFISVLKATFHSLIIPTFLLISLSKFDTEILPLGILSSMAYLAFANYVYNIEEMGDDLTQKYFSYCGGFMLVVLILLTAAWADMPMYSGSL